MPQEDKQFGKHWIIKTLRSLADESDIQIDLEWGPDDFDRDLCPLLVRSSGKQVVEKFSDEDLTDCQHDKNVQSDIEERLKKLIKSIAPQGKRIGF